MWHSAIPRCIHSSNLEFLHQRTWEICIRLIADSKKLEFHESDVSPGQTEVKQSKFVKFISQMKSYFRETYKSQNIYPIFPTPKFALGKGVSASKLFVTMLLHSCFPLIWYATWPCSDKTEILIFWPLTLGLWRRREGVCVQKFATMLLHSWFPLIWYANWPCSEKVEFWPIDPIPRFFWGGRGICRQNMLLPCCCNHDSL